MYESFIYFLHTFMPIFAIFNSVSVYLEYILQILGQEHILKKRENQRVIALSSEEEDAEPEAQKQAGISQHNIHRKPEFSQKFGS